VHPRVTAAEIPHVATYVDEVAGIVLDSSKSYLVESRLGPVAEREGFTSYSALVRAARADVSGRLKRLVVDAITTNETYFFRDERPFQLLAHKLIPDLLERQMQGRRYGLPKLDIWCAGCASGQEVYSIAMVLKEMLGRLDRYRIRILGTDISDAILTVASRAIYTRYELTRGVSASRRQRFFTPEGELFKITDELRSLATYRNLNLMRSFRHVGTYDLIFCRNVAIYFSIANRRTLYAGLANQLRPNGGLLVGSTESLIGVTDRFVRQSYRGAVYYTKKP